jgi:hypothetical protein
LDWIYTGRIVPEGIGGSSLDQRRIPHPSREQELKIVSPAKASIKSRRIVLMFIIRNVY